MAVSINNYTVGKGIVSIKKTGDVTFTDIGNCPTFEFTPEVTKLDHFSSREGVKTKDLSVVLEKKGTLKIVLEEFSVENIALAILGTTTGAPGSSVTEIFATAQVTAEVKFTATQDIGPKYEWHFLGVDFIPGKTISLISDTWGTLELSGEVKAVGGSFGTVTEIA